MGAYWKVVSKAQDATIVVLKDTAEEPYPSGSGPTMGGDKGGCLG